MKLVFGILFYVLLFLQKSCVKCDRNSAKTELSLDLLNTRAVTVEKPFNITFNLPNSIKLGETLKILIKIDNNLNETIDCTATLRNDARELMFMNETDDGEGLKTKIFNIDSNDSKVLTFVVKPIIFGEIKLYFSVVNSLYNETILRNLKVQPAGIEQKYNNDIFIKSADNETLKGKFSLNIPDSTMDNTLKINLRVASDFLKPTIENLEKLIEIPTAGSGEANMINFAPGVLILQYLISINKHLQEKELVAKIKRLIESGYQQELSYRTSNGAFKAFAEGSEGEDSIWLTAYVIRYFIKAEKFNITIDTKVIETGLEYLKEQQLSDGSFEHNGYLFLPGMESKIALTSFVLITLLESRKYANKYRSIINKGAEYLESNLDNIQDIYDLTLAATAFKCAGNRNYFYVIEKLLELSHENDLGHKWWSANDGSKERDIELTSYVQLALLGAPIDETPVLEWLLVQRNGRGGFKSTQDTVMGILTLIKLARYYQNTNETNITFEYIAKDQANQEVYKNSFNINSEDLNDLQIQELPSTTHSLDYSINGSGYIFAQLAYQYYLPYSSKSLLTQSHQHRNFLIEPKVNSINTFLSNLEICFTYQSRLNQNNNTNMIIMEINLPTGFQTDALHSTDTNECKLLQHMELKQNNTVIIMYFSLLTVNEKNCLKIGVEKKFEVMDLQPGLIKIYDFYNTSRSDMMLFNMNLQEFKN